MKFRHVEVDDERIAKMDQLLEMYATAPPELKVRVRNGIVSLMFIVAADAKIRAYENVLRRNGSLSRFIGRVRSLFGGPND